MKDISKRIQQLRQQSGMTQEELANRLHVTRQAVSNWENRKTRPDIDTLEALARVFDLDVVQLIYGDGSPQSWKSRWLPTAVYGGAVAVWLLLAFFALPAANEALKRGYDGSLAAALRCVCGVLSAALCPLVFSALQVRLPMHGKSLRPVLLTVGILLAGLYAAWWMLWPISILLDGLPNWVQRRFVIPFIPVAVKPWLPIVSGSLLYLGLPKRKTAVPSKDEN